VHALLLWLLLLQLGLSPILKHVVCARGLRLAACGLRRACRACDSTVVLRWTASLPCYSGSCMVQPSAAAFCGVQVALIISILNTLQSHRRSRKSERVTNGDNPIGAKKMNHPASLLVPVAVSSLGAAVGVSCLCAFGLLSRRPQYKGGSCRRLV